MNSISKRKNYNFNIKILEFIKFQNAKMINDKLKIFPLQEGKIPA